MKIFLIFIQLTVLPIVHFFSYIALCHIKKYILNYMYPINLPDPSILRVNFFKIEW